MRTPPASPSGRAPESTTPAPGAAPGVGDRIGPFRLVELIGAGGMGRVFRAVRADGAFNHQVAIKLTAAPLASAEAWQRVRAERQILASLKHARIVTFLDAGLAAGGHAYLVMEYVDGVPITDYCRTRALPLAARLRLFTDVCAAVQFAHGHSVLHHDLKPGNILVTADGVPKVLDFGVATLLGPLHDKPANSLTGPTTARLTPNYASPEQLRGLPLTTASDVYALGVLLFELLTDARPYETGGKPLDEVLRLVVDADPPKPSMVAARPDAALPYSPKRTLAGDLDVIVDRAMQKALEQRYRSAGELAADVMRHLDGTPIVARGQSIAYVASKLAARHRASFAAVCVSTLLVAIALVVAMWQAAVAMTERERAEQRFSDTRRMANTLIVDIDEAVARLPASTPVRTAVVAEGLAYLERLAADAKLDPDLQLEMAGAYWRIGKVQGYHAGPNLGDRKGAIHSFRQAQQLLMPQIVTGRASEAATVAYVQILSTLSQTLYYSELPAGDEQAVTAAREALQAAESFHARQPHDLDARRLLAGTTVTAATIVGWPESLPLWKNAAASYRALLAEQPDDPIRQRDLALIEKYLGAYYEQSGDHAAALVHHGRSYELYQKQLSSVAATRQDHFALSINVANLGYAAMVHGRLAEAAKLYEQALELRQALANTDPLDALAQTRVAFAHRQLARIYEQRRDLERAAAHARAAVTLYEPRSKGDVEARLALGRSLWALAMIEAASGRDRAGCAALQRAVAVLKTVPVRHRARENRGRRDDLPALLEQAAACDRGEP